MTRGTSPYIVAAEHIASDPAKIVCRQPGSQLSVGATEHVLGGFS